MTKKRIIYQLNIENGQVRNMFSFDDMISAISPVEASKYIENKGVDSLLLWNNYMTDGGRKSFLKSLREISESIKIPIAVSTEIASLEDADTYMKAGVSQLVLDSKVMETPELVDDLSLKFGEQSVAVSIFSERTEQGNFVCTHKGTRKTNKRTEAWITQLEQLGAGEIFLTSMGSEQSIFDISIAKYVSHAVSLPVILSIGKEQLGNLKEILDKTTISGIFTEDISIREAMQKLI